MGSTVRSLTHQSESESATSATIRWQSWPLFDHLRSSWLLPAAIGCVGAFVWMLGGGMLLSLTAIAALCIALWQFLLPIKFEICSLGVRRYALGRMRLVPWSAIRAYQLRSTGAVFFQRPHPADIDMLTSFFVPYPSDEDEMVVAVRLYLSHAVELP
jgi:hypothetical protein